MPDASAREVTAALRKRVHPTLIRLGFGTIKPRYARKQTPDCSWILSLKCVGAYFSSVTGFPALSLCATAGVNYPCLPNPWADITPTDKDGNPQSLQVYLELTGDIAQQPRRGLSSAEAQRADVWWVERDGSNLDAVATDLASSIEEQGSRWFASWGSAESALQSSLLEPGDYPGRTWRIYALAKALNNSEVLHSYREKLQKQWPKHFGKLI
jgi:hypothetical protein